MRDMQIGSHSLTWTEVRSKTNRDDRNFRDTLKLDHLRIKDKWLAKYGI